MPFVEIDGRITGSLEFEVLNSATSLVSHEVHLIDQDLAWGESAAELHDSEEGTLSGSLTTIDGSTFAVH